MKEDKKSKKTKKERDDENLNRAFKTLENTLKDSFLVQIKASEKSIKSYLENRVQVYFDEIGGRIAELIEDKYSKIHDRSYSIVDSSCQHTKEEVLQAVEFVVSIDNVSKMITKYMGELSLIRLLFT